MADRDFFQRLSYTTVMVLRVRQFIAAASLVLLMLLMTPLGAGARGVHLDRTFGRGGGVVEDSVSPGQGGGVRIVEAPGGRLVVGVGHTVLLYLPNGGLDSSFGSGGRVDVETPENSAFSISGLAVDSQGRVLVAGTTFHYPSQESLAIPPAPTDTIGRTKATIRRYLSNGDLDPSFNGDGILETDFGLPAPIDRASGQPFEEPVTRIAGLSIDSRGRIVILASTASEYRDCGEIRTYYNETFRSFVARLTAQGYPDPTFGGGSGMSPSIDVGVQEFGGWLGLDPGDRPIFLTVSGGCRSSPSALGQLDMAGNVDANFGSEGWRLVRGNRNAGELAVDGAGRIFLLGPSVLNGSSPRSDEATIRRLLGNGKLDRRFGRRGRASIPLPKHSRPAALLPDGQGGVWAVGSLVGSRSKAGTRSSSFLLTGLDRTGHPRPELGRAGVVVTRFPDGVLAYPVAGLVDRQGKVVIVDEFTLSEPSKSGVAMVRYAVR